MNRWFAVLNPASRGGKGRKMFPDILTTLRHERITFHPAVTQHKGHAISLTQDALRRGYRSFICIGGDGTMNEVINGIFGQQDIPPDECAVSMFAVGMGKDWIKTVGIPTGIEEAVHALKRGTTLLQDVGRVTFYTEGKKRQRFFANVAGIGYDAFVTDIVNKMKERGRSGTLPYLMTLLTCLMRYKHRRVQLTVDKMRTEADVFSMNVGIGQYSGGGMKQVPHAIPDDGLFDVTFIKNVTKLDVLRNVKNLYDGSFIEHPKIMTFRGKEIAIHADPHIDLEIDGENVGHSPFHFSILPRSLRVVGVQ
jgi:YegS/Rv2252/BmrU family lipid kinase